MDEIASATKQTPAIVDYILEGVPLNRIRCIKVPGTKADSIPDGWEARPTRNRFTGWMPGVVTAVNDDGAVEVSVNVCQQCEHHKFERDSDSSVLCCGHSKVAGMFCCEGCHAWQLFDAFEFVAKTKRLKCPECEQENLLPVDSDWRTGFPKQFPPSWCPLSEMEP